MKIQIKGDELIALKKSKKAELWIGGLLIFAIIFSFGIYEHFYGIKSLPVWKPLLILFVGVLIFSRFEKCFPKFWDYQVFLKTQGFALKEENGKIKRTPEVPYAAVYEKEGKEYWVTNMDLSSADPKIYMDEV